MIEQRLPLVFARLETVLDGIVVRAGEEDDAAMLAKQLEITFKFLYSSKL